MIEDIRPENMGGPQRKGAGRRGEKSRND